MKKMLFTLLAACTLSLVGCLESTQEVTIKEDGSGTVSYTSDMSALVGMIKQMGGAEDIKESEQALDSTISMDQIADSIPNLTDNERALMKKSEMRINMDMNKEKLLLKMHFPFNNVSAIEDCNRLSGIMVGEALKGQPGMEGMSEDGGSPQFSSFEEYFKTVYSNGRIEKTLIKEKYEKVGEDEFFKSMKESEGLGLSMKANYIINLPRPASKAEGKGLTLSEDKKKITIAVSMEDFFDEPAKFEYVIEY
ncbi:MAG TPA: hypothetical protein PLL23_01005 [Chitinophagaceae bacterium]|nr:hypothetical protein [Chitinophagaceae bacterium]